AALSASGSTAAPALSQGIRVTLRTVSPAVSVNTLRLTLKDRFRSRLRHRPQDMRGTLAAAPGRRPELSIRRCRDNAERRRTPDDHHWAALRSSDDLSRSRRLYSSDERSRVFPLRTMRTGRAFRGRVRRGRVNCVAGAIAIVVSNPRHRKSQTVLVAAFRREVEIVVCAEQDVAAARVR